MMYSLCLGFYIIFVPHNILEVNLFCDVKQIIPFIAE